MARIGCAMPLPLVPCSYRSCNYTGHYMLEHVLFRMELFGSITTGSSQPVKSAYYTSCSNNDHHIIRAISGLYLSGERPDCDLCYNIGNMYPNGLQPVHKYDINPNRAGIGYHDYTRNSLPAKSFKSVIADPPFIIGNHPKYKDRYTTFKSLTEMQANITGLITTAAYIIKRNGVFAIKTQDCIHDRRKFFLSNFVFNSAIIAGFTCLDQFILTAKSRIHHSHHNNQYASRSYHCTWLVFRKIKSRKRYVLHDIKI